MKIDKNLKVILGILTVGQIFAFMWLIIWALTDLKNVLLPNGPEDPAVVLDFFMQLLIPIVVITLLSLGLLIFYIIHAAMNTQIETGIKVLWVFLFLIFGSIAEVIYFFLEVVPERSLTSQINQMEPIKAGHNPPPSRAK